MVIPILDAAELLTVPKKLMGPQKWRRKSNAPSMTPILFFETRVRLDASIRRGLRFRVSVFPRHPNVATFQLEMEQPPSRTCLTLYRLDWRPLSGHANGRSGPEELWDIVFKPGDTHEHVCTDNASYSKERVLKSGVQAARKIEPDFENYDSALSYVCGKINIINSEDIPPSNAQWEIV